MRRLSAAIALIGWLLLVGSATVLSSPSPVTLEASKATVTPLIPQPMPTPRVPPDKTYYRKRCWPACHYDSAWISEEPPRETFDFESTLKADWTWINEDATHWTLTEVPGALRIASQSGSIGGADGLQGAENVLVREAPAGYFDLIAKVTFEPRASFQQAAIFIQLDDGSVVSVSRGYCRDEDDPPCVEDGVYFDGAGIGCARVGIPTSAETANLMLRKAGNSYVGYYCLGESIEPEADWIEVGRCYNPDVSPVQVGLVATNGERADVPKIPADFELATLVERK